MPAKFYPKPAYFETKSQVCPNSLVFNHKLTDSGMRLILALNAISTCTVNWVACQTDLQNRFRWGEEKMLNAIKSCVKNGYLKVRQGRNSGKEDIKEKGRFSQNEFEFDIDGGYPKNNNIIIEEECLHNECEPSGGFPGPADPIPDNPGLPCSKKEPCIKTEMLLGTDVPIENKSFEKTKQQASLVKDDVHAYCIRRKLDWSSDEIDFSWSVFFENQHNVSDAFAYIEGVIIKKRNIEESKKIKQRNK